MQLAPPLSLGSSPPYCGPAPLPGELLARWNPDPLLIGSWIGVGALALLLLRRRGADLPRGRPLAFAGGWAIALAAWVSPLCALGVALFSARVGQHMVLALTAAPLLAYAWPARAGAPDATRSAVTAWLALTAATWFWHLPGPYQATFRSDAVYWTMHATLLASAVATWRVLLARHGSPLVPSGLALASCLQMSALGALLSFAPAPWFAPHLATAGAWGLSPLEDQQLGGLLLWVPGCFAFLLAAVAPVAELLKAQDGPARRPVL